MTVRCLVTGATGYIGGRLVPELLKAGHTVRCAARSEGRLRGQPWVSEVDVVQADAMHCDSMLRALTGMDVAYYLIHTMGAGGNFADQDRRAATVFGAAAHAAGIRRIVYLGGLTPEDDLSPHLRSRAEVGDILLASGVPTAVLRAGVIIGSGSSNHPH
ncbi:NAD(P)H-binding protein [Sinosporangium album]|nr:NAD(P)H-binding protein [Sinosporangium album]